MDAPTGLDAGLFVGRQDAIGGRQRLALPATFVKLQHPVGLLLEVRVAGKDPTAVVPRAQGVFAQPTPQGGLADRSHEAAADGFAPDLRDTQPSQGKAVLMR